MTPLARHRESDPLRGALDDAITALQQALGAERYTLRARDVGVIHFIGQGIAHVHGLPGICADELIRFPGDRLGMAFNIDPDEVGVVMLNQTNHLRTGMAVYRTGRTLDIPVGEALLGRVVDAVGRPLDDRGPVRAGRRLPIERPAPAVMDRAPVTVPLQTGVKVVDALIPVGRGQRELILGDRQTGKTALALDTIINQRGRHVICIYCAIGQRLAAVARIVADLRAYDALEYSVVVVSTGEDPPGLQFVAPYAATSIAEYFMEQGRDVLVVYDDLTQHARAYRELSLLLRRPPGREAFPGDIFFIHARLLERATHLCPELGGGSLTALPIVETEAQDISAYIPTNLISITDGQIYLSPDLFQKGILPAVDVGRSVSRVGGKTQLAAYRSVTGRLRLAYAQFEELEAFARFGTRLDEQTRRTLERGRLVREVLKQPQYAPMSEVAQVAILFAVIEGFLDDLPLNLVRHVEDEASALISADQSGLSRRIAQGEELSDPDRVALGALVRAAVEHVKSAPGEASPEERHADA